MSQQIAPDFRLEQVAQNVYAFISNNTTHLVEDGNTTVILTQRGVVVVDAPSTYLSEKHLAEIRKLTTKPVIYLINTHWHLDHVFGNHVYRDAFPDLHIIAQDYTKAFDLRRVVRQQEAGVWQPFVASALPGKTLGILGYGGLGSAAAERARCFGMKIAALRRRPELFNGHGLDAAYGPAQLHELMSESDYLLAAAPLTPQTRGMIGEEQIAAMKPSAVIVNIGRGAVIDEAALIRALESNRIRGAALDVFATEPLPAGHAFYRLPNVLLSPHTADRVDGFLAPAFACFVDNLDRFLKGQPLLNLVDKHAGY